MPLRPRTDIFGLVTALLGVVALSPATIQAQHPDVPLPERARGAERVVVGRVSSIAPQWRENEFAIADCSVVRVAVDETLKGAASQSMDVEVEGGTIGPLTLRVSDLDALEPGDRAVFYVRRDRRGAFVPHLRGRACRRSTPPGGFAAAA